MPAGSRQLEIDWSRGRQLAILRDCVLPQDLRAVDGRPVSASTAKLVLKMIDDFGRGATAFVSLNKLAEVCGLKSTKTITRATQALAALSLLRVEHDGRRKCNRYTVDFRNLVTLCPDHSPSCNSPVSQAEERVSTMAGSESGTVQRMASVSSQRVFRTDPDRQRRPRDACPIAAERKDTGAERKDTGAERKDTCVPLTVPRSAKEPPPPTPSDEPCHWGTAAAELRAFGLQRVMAAIQFAKDRGLTPPEVLDAIQVAKANARLFARPAAALYVWLQSSEWPADGVRDCRTLQAERERQTDAKRQARLQDAVHHAWLKVRRKTPAGTVVDDREVVDVAVAMGVPRELAMAERGLVLV